MRYRFGPFELDGETGTLTRDGRTVALRGQPAKLLLQLVRADGRLVTREAIHARLWSHPFVRSDLGINQCVRRIRAALGDDARRPLFIETLPGRGYRFVATVSVVESLPESRGATARRRTFALAVPSAVLGGVALAALSLAAGPPADTAAGAEPTAVDLAVARTMVSMDRRRPDLIPPALAELEEVAAHAPGDATPWLRLAVGSSLSHWFSGDEEAARAARRHLRVAEGMAGPAGGVDLARATLAFHERDYAGALAALARAGAEAGGAPGEAELLRGNVLARMGRWEEAERALLRAYRLRPTSFETTYAVASLARLLGRHGRARDFLSRAAQLDEAHPIPKVLRPLDALRAGWSRERVERELSEVAGSVAAGFVFAASQTLSRVFAAEVVAGPAEFDGPESFRHVYHLSVAEALRVSGRPREAEPHYLAARRLLERGMARGWSPYEHRGRALALLAAVEAGLGRREAALDLVDRALAAVAVEPDAVADAWIRHQLAQDLAVAGEPERAAALVRGLLARPSTLTVRALRLDPVWRPLWEGGHLDFVGQPVVEAEGG